MFVEKLKTEYGVNEPIFTSEILNTVNEYSRPRVFQLIKKAEQDGTLARFDTGIYYIPTKTRYGKSTITVEQAVRKKYIESNGKVFGIYGGLNMRLDFLLTYQVPIALEVVTNNETMWVRKIKIRGRNIILRKSRCEINKYNAGAYTLLELFNGMDIAEYKGNVSVRREIIDFAKKKGVVISQIIALAGAFPSKATKNIMESGFINEIA